MYVVVQQILNNHQKLMYHFYNNYQDEHIDGNVDHLMLILLTKSKILDLL
jgi:hypothetical protein